MLSIQEILAQELGQKLEYVETFLAQHKIKLDFDTLLAMVDAEIKKMEQNEPALLVPAEALKEAE